MKTKKNISFAIGRTLAIMLVGLISIGIVGATPTNLVVNGGFEEPVVPEQYTWLGYYSIPGWVEVDGERMEIQTDRLFDGPYEGHQYLEFDAYSNTNIYQDITTVPGRVYRLNFAFSPRQEIDDNQLQISWDGAVVDTLSASGVGNLVNVWTTHTYDLNAVSTTTRLEFENIDIENMLGTFLDDVSVTLLIKTVNIDIKPGSDPNSFNNNGHGVIPVAILGSPYLDVTDIDAGSVSLEGMAIRAVGKSNKLLAHYEDVNEDGYEDLVVQIEDTDGTFIVGDTTATLTGVLSDGTTIQGQDSIRIIPQ